MAAEVENMFYTREKPWHGLGVQVQEAPTSGKALWLAGLDWKVLQKDIYTEGRVQIPGYKANVRDTDSRVLGVVTDRYKVIQNEEAFAFTDTLLGNGVRYETAGALQDGKKVWLLARLPREYIMSGEHISPYLVFSNTHDGSGFINAVSDFATHSSPLRKTASYNENMFSRTVDGNPLIDRAYQIIKAA